MYKATVDVDGGPNRLVCVCVLHTKHTPAAWQHLSCRGRCEALATALLACVF